MMADDSANEYSPLIIILKELFDKSIQTASNTWKLIFPECFWMILKSIQLISSLDWHHIGVWKKNKVNNDGKLSFK